MNLFIIIGNLTRDPELSTTSSGVSRCTFSVAVPRTFSKDGEKETDFFNCTAWRTLGENVAKFCTKGSKVCVKASVQIRKYTDNNGVEKTAVDVIANEVEFLNTAKQTAQRENQDNTRSGQTRAPKTQVFDDFGDIPF